MGGIVIYIDHDGPTMPGSLVSILVKMLIGRKKINPAVS